MMLDHYAGGDNVYKALIGEKKWTDEEFVGAFTMLNDWFQKGYYSGSIENYHSLTWNDNWPNLATGKGAMMMCGTWGFQGAAPAFKDSGQEWDWFPMPSLRSGVNRVYSLGIGTTLSINAATKNPKQAAEAMDFILNDKTRAMNIASGFQFGEWVIPLVLKPEDFPSSTDPRVLRYFDDFVKTTGAGDYGYTTWTFYPAKTEVYLYEGFEEVILGNQTVVQYLDNYQKQFDEDLKSGKVPPVPKRNVA
jgi:raffinose/stachyose/melibiose transport system substrate-binding protein